MPCHKPSVLQATNLSTAPTLQKASSENEVLPEVLFLFELLDYRHGAHGHVAAESCLKVLHLFMCTCHVSSHSSTRRSRARCGRRLRTPSSRHAALHPHHLSRPTSFIIYRTDSQQERLSRPGGKTGRQDTETRSQQVRPAIHGAHSMYGVTCSCAVTCWHAMTYVHACMAHMHKHARMSRHTTA